MATDQSPDVSGIIKQLATIKSEPEEVNRYLSTLTPEQLSAVSSAFHNESRRRRVTLSPELADIPLWQRMRDRIAWMDIPAGWSILIRCDESTDISIGSREDEEAKQVVIYIPLDLASNYAEENLFNGLREAIECGQMGVEQGRPSWVARN